MFTVAHWVDGMGEQAPRKELAGHRQANDQGRQGGAAAKSAGSAEPPDCLELDEDVKAPDEKVAKVVTSDDVEDALLQLQSYTTRQVLELGREFRTQIIHSQTEHRQSLDRACEFYSSVLQERVDEQMWMKSTLWRDKVSRELQNQVHILDAHLTERLNGAATTLRQLIHDCFSNDNGFKSQPRTPPPQARGPDQCSYYRSQASGQEKAGRNIDLRRNSF